MKRVVLREDVRPGVVRLFAETRGWPEVAAVPAGPGRAAETVWEVGDGYLHLIERQDLGLLVLVLKGEAADREDDVRASLHTIDEADLRAPLPDDAAAAARALYRAVAAAREPDAGLAAVLSAGLRHPDPDVRRVALYTVACVRWPDLRPAVEALVGTEPDLDVAAYAADLLNAWT
jgi:hypothetical protein